MNNIIKNAIYNTTIIGYESNGSTVRNPGIGLSTYQILPQVNTFIIAGNSENISSPATNYLMGGYNSIIQLTNATDTTNKYNIWGKANTHIFSYYCPTGTVRNISYTYIDSNGNEGIGTATGVGNSYVGLYNSTGTSYDLVCINEFHVTGNTQLTSTDDMRIYLSTVTTNPITFTGTASKIVSNLSLNNYYSGFFTCPNNAIAMITSIDGYLSTANDYYSLNLWDRAGNRSILGVYNMYIPGSNVNNMRTAGGGEYGCIGRIIKAGETIAFSCYTSSSQSRNIYANIKVVYF